jgi:hypothetical protein
MNKFRNLTRHLVKIQKEIRKLLVRVNLNAQPHKDQLGLKNPASHILAADQVAVSVLEAPLI